MGGGGRGNHFSWELKDSHDSAASHTRRVVCLIVWLLTGVPVALQVTVEEQSFLAHPTRNRAKIQHSRRPPTRGHLMAVVSAGGGREQAPIQPAKLPELLLLLPLLIAACAVCFFPRGSGGAQVRLSSSWPPLSHQRPGGSREAHVHFCPLSFPHSNSVGSAIPIWSCTDCTLYVN